MIKSKNVFILVVGLFLLSSVTFASEWTWPEYWAESQTADQQGVKEFHQSPMLDEAVKNGELPPVEERLPKNPVVRKPYQEIGQYGGTARVASTSPNAYCDITHMRIPNLFTSDTSVTKVISEVAESFELSDDAKKLTVRLREGLKWSDGHPFTTEDIRFWWEDEVLDKDISVWSKGFWILEGKLPEFKVIDKYAVEFTFPKSFQPVKGMLNYWIVQQLNFFDPAHYMKKFHKKYNPDVEKLAKEEGYDNWLQLFYARRDIEPSQKYPETPVLGAWMLESRSSTKKVYVRNPYYWAVDTEGNQLPYIDRLEVNIFSDQEIAVLDAMQGNLDFAGFILSPSDFAMYKANEDKGDYSVFAWRSANASQATYAFNLNHPDEAKREIFQDVRFRRAMSLAINREEINQFVYQGLATPSQVTVLPGTSYYEDWWATSYADYDPDQANQLLDEMGLKKGSDGFRRRPDGEILTIALSAPSAGEAGNPGLDETNDLIAQYWNEVGVKTEFQIVSRELYHTRTSTGQHDVGVFHADRMQELRAYIPGATKFEMSAELDYANEWAAWHSWKLWNENGQIGNEPSSKGWEPPQDVKDYFTLLDSWYAAQTNEEYKEIAKELWSFHAENLWLIGTVARPLSPVIISNRLHNVPEQLPFSDGTSWWRIAKPAQWYIGQ